jgi:hypothetical protein
MISLDGAPKNIPRTSAASKSFKKEGVKRKTFLAGGRAKETANNESTREVGDVSPMLFLQEINDYDIEKRDLEEFGKQSIRNLRELQIAIIKGELTENHLHNIKNTIENSKSKFNTPNLAELAEDIILRMEVEIAKIEMNKR